MSKLTMMRGDTRSLHVLVEDDQGPVNLAPMSLRFTARQHANDTTAVIEKTESDMTMGTTGEAFITLDPEDTEMLAGWSQLVWDLEIIDMDIVSTVASGTLIVTPDVSHAEPSSS